MFVAILPIRLRLWKVAMLDIPAVNIVINGITTLRPLKTLHKIRIDAFENCSSQEASALAAIIIADIPVVKYIQRDPKKRHTHILFQNGG